MSGSEAPSRWNYLRRAVGATICLAPVALLVTSLVASEFLPRESGLGLGLVVCALFPTALNVYLSWLRPTIYRWRHGSLDGLRNVSGVPLLGTLFVVPAGVIGFGDWRVAALGLFVQAFDSGGLLWFLIATWCDQSLWDA
jgi:hypothetical protein